MRTLGSRLDHLLHKGDYVGGGVSGQCGVTGCPNPLGSTISTAMTINTLVVLLLEPCRVWRDSCDP